MNNTYDTIIEFATYRNTEALQKMSKSLSLKISNMDMYFEVFLSKESLDRKQHSKAWDKYRKMTDEYVELVENLKIVNYYMEKFNV